MRRPRRTVTTVTVAVLLVKSRPCHWHWHLYAGFPGGAGDKLSGKLSSVVFPAGPGPGLPRRGGSLAGTVTAAGLHWQRVLGLAGPRRAGGALHTQASSFKIGSSSSRARAESSMEGPTGPDHWQRADSELTREERALVSFSEAAGTEAGPGERRPGGPPTSVTSESRRRALRLRPVYRCTRSTVPVLRGRSQGSLT
jgi:hypothetical protein